MNTLQNEFIGIISYGPYIYYQGMKNTQNCMIKITTKEYQNNGKWINNYKEIELGKFTGESDVLIHIPNRSTKIMYK